MNNDIKIMIKLQAFWDKITQSNEEIEKSKNKISNLQDVLEKKLKEIDDLKSEIKELNKNIKQNEVELYNLDNKIKKIEERKELLKTEREIAAQKTERERIEKERDELEEMLIGLMDDLESKEKKLIQLENEYTENKTKTNVDLEGINEKISDLDVIVNSNQEKFDNNIDDLSKSLKQKFIKLLNSKNIAIACVNGEICEGCNIKIPASLAIDAAKEDKVTVCSNCSRFIYNDYS